jgi:hypothetical protein
MWIARREYEFLLGEIEWLRGRLDAEKRRADLAADSLIEALGHLPISDTGVDRSQESKREARDLEDATKELWASDTAEFDRALKSETEGAGGPGAN